MTIPRGVRFAASVLLGAAGGWFMWTRLEPLQPFLEFSTERVAHTESYELWDVIVTVRGGETVEEIAVRPASGPVHVVGDGHWRGARSGQSKHFRAQIDGSGVRGVVRIDQLGRVPNTTDVPVGGVP